METLKPSDALLAALTSASEARAKVKLETVQAVFLKCVPHWQGAADRRERLRALLDELVVAGRLRLPSDRRRGWERTPTPPLPKWVLLVREPEPEQVPFDHRSFPWVAELAFIASLRVLRNPREVLRIHEFFKTGGRRRPIVPVKERSYEIFGDEKRLDDLRGSQLFAQGRLILEILRCRDVSTSLPCVPAPRRAKEPWLIVENEATFHSFCRMNRVISLHHGIILGSGNAALRAVDFLAGLYASASPPGAKEFHYFGDLDEEGIRIPNGLDRQMERFAGIRVRPCERYYEWLLEEHRVAAAQPGFQRPFSAVNWFPQALGERVSAALARKGSLAQEAIGWEKLAEKFGIDPALPF